ncbi:immunoglobulin-binding protein 1-like [Diadema antillarum]|uniref:immunoglobulin-binding protein 1-like n=1 Tax=Diadema antillarum TaxID=105358 RepID=UPI003A87778B
MATPMDSQDGASRPQLSTLFDDARIIQTQLENSSEPSNSSAFQGKLKEAISHLEEATHRVNELSLFSRNEDIEELPTAHIRYLLLPALLGDLSLRLMGEERLDVVERSKAYFVDYIRRCRDYGITKEEVPEDPSPDAPPQSAPGIGGARPNLMAMQCNREDKIRRYKEAKEREQKLNALGTWEEVAKRDEDVQREFYLLVLKKWVGTALEQLSSIQQEREILQHMAKMKKSSGNRGNGDGDSRRDAPQQQPQRKPMKPFILTKDALQAQVFGAGYPSIPTMTLDEFYEKEIREGKIKLDSQNPSQQSEREAAEARDIKKEMEIETDDPEALRKAREWDEWKDDHKRGWGNRENRS